MNKETETQRNVPLILHDFQTAQSLGEDGINDFRASRNENKACVQAILAAKEENTTYGDMAGVTYFDAKKTVDDVLGKGFSPERLGLIIAYQVVPWKECLDNPKMIDGRFSSTVKEWAISLIVNSCDCDTYFRNFEGCYLTDKMHRVLINSLAEKYIEKQQRGNKKEKPNRMERE